MNTRKVIVILGASVAILLVLNSITLVLLMRQRSEIDGLLSQGSDREKPVSNWSMDTKVPVTATQTVSIVLGEMNQENGLHLVYDINDGLTKAVSMGGVECRELTGLGEMAKMHFAVDQSFKLVLPMPSWVEVEYFDASPNGALSLEYDGPKAYTRGVGRFPLENSGQWKTATFGLPDAEFKRRENGGADFRIIATKPKVFIRRVTLKTG